MSATTSAAFPFPELIGRLRAGDERAAEQFVARYAPALRRVSRVLALQRGCRLESEEIAQSVLASVCVRLQLGQFHFAAEDDLNGLLYRMARNKAADRGRDGARRAAVPWDEKADAEAGGAPDSAQLSLEIREVLAKARAAFAADEWDLVRRRQDGQNWVEIAAASGEKPDAVRKRYERAVERVAALLGLDRN